MAEIFAMFSKIPRDSISLYKRLVGKIFHRIFLISASPFNLKSLSVFVFHFGVNLFPLVPIFQLCIVPKLPYPRAPKIQPP